MAAARLGYLVGPSWLVGELDKVALPYHLDTAKQIAGVLALTFVDAMEERIARAGVRARAVSSRRSATSTCGSGRRARTSCCSGRSQSGDKVWQGLLDRSVLVRNCASWPRLDDCLRVTIGTPTENDRFLEALAEVIA